MNRGVYCRPDRNLCSRCVFMKIKENGWTVYFKTRQLVLIYVFNVLLVKYIWRTIIKITHITRLMQSLYNTFFH